MNGKRKYGFSGIFLVLTQVYQNRFMPVAIELIDGMYYWRFPQISQGVWIGFAVLQLCSVLLTPVLSVSLVLPRWQVHSPVRP